MRFFSNPDNRFEKYYTLAQLARRVGISEGRARALWAEADRLPKPDAKDADDHPLWQASSIDRWCKQTGRPVRDPDNNRGLSTWQDAAQPAPIVFSREVVLRERSALPARVYLVAWDTPQGHLVLVTNFAGYRIPERRAAEAAAQILEPVFWEQAIVMISQDVPLGCKDDVFIRPMNMYRIERESGQLDPENVEIKYIGVCWRDDAARVIGQPIPIWLEGTCLPENIQKFKTIGQAKTFLVPDTTTTWPDACHRLAVALKGQMPEKFPQAFAELARNTLDILEEVQHKHRQQSDSGEGWYLVARPDRPYWPVALEQAARRAIETEVSLDMAAQELKQLREIEAGKEYGDDLGRVLYEAIEQLAIRLLPHYPELGFAPIVRHLVKPIGPVFEQWKQTLTPISDKEVEELKATRRFTRLLADEIEPQVGDDFISKARECIGSCWRDPIGRLVVELQKTTSEGTTVFAVEWPTTLPHEWNEETILASDPEMSGTLFAISSALDGNLRVDPVPNPGAEPNYSWGYEGTSPWNLYWALFRCACGLYASQNNEWKGDRLDALYEQSKLWRYITTLDGDAPFRLRWSQIQAWVHEDSRSLERINGN